jgi:hypothetical protein
LKFTSWAFFIECVQILENRGSSDVGVSAVAISIGDTEFSFLVVAVFEGEHF